MIESLSQVGQGASIDVPVRKPNKLDARTRLAPITTLEVQAPERRLQPFDGTIPPRGFDWLFAKSVAILVARGPGSERAVRRLVTFDPNPNPEHQLSFGGELAVQAANANHTQTRAPGSLDIHRILHENGQTPSTMDTGSYVALFLSRLNDPLTRDQLTAEIRQLHSLVRTKLIGELRPKVTEQIEASLPFANPLENISSPQEADVALSNLKSWYISSGQSWRERATYWEAKRLLQAKHDAITAEPSQPKQPEDEPTMVRHSTLRLSRRAIRSHAKLRRYDSQATEEVLDNHKQLTDKLAQLGEQKDGWRRNVAGTVEKVDIKRVRREIDQVKSDIYRLDEVLKERRKPKPTVTRWH